MQIIGFAAHHPLNSYLLLCVILAVSVNFSAQGFIVTWGLLEQFVFLLKIDISQQRTYSNITNNPPIVITTIFF